MTEEEWLAASDPKVLIEFQPGKANDRQLRLLACAWCRRIWHLLTDNPTRSCVEVAEAYADGQASRDELDAASAGVSSIGLYSLGSRAAAAHAVGECAYGYSPFGGGYHVSLNSYHCFCAGGELQGEYDAQCHLLRDIFGNPFRPVVADPAWRTPTVQSIASAIYNDRAFDRLPILADALEEAGCTNADVLLHCRQPAEHVRGCWVVDLALGKE